MVLMQFYHTHCIKRAIGTC